MEPEPRDGHHPPPDLRAYLFTGADGRRPPGAVRYDRQDERRGGLRPRFRRGSPQPARRDRLDLGGKPWQRSHINTDQTPLMSHAFRNPLRARRLKTNVLNDKSRNAMKRIGCVEEAAQHAVNDDGCGATPSSACHTGGQRSGSAMMAREA
jgi:hypothetical protein